MSVQRNEQDRGVVLKDVLGPIAVMDVPIQDEDAGSPRRPAAPKVVTDVAPGQGVASGIRVIPGWHPGQRCAGTCADDGVRPMPGTMRGWAVAAVAGPAR